MKWSFGLTALAFSPNGKELIGLGKALTVWDVTTGSELRASR